MAENDPSHSAASEIQANTALPIDTTVSARAYAAHRQVRRQTSCPVVEVPSNASLRDLITFSLTVLQEPEVYTQSAISISLLKYWPRISEVADRVASTIDQVEIGTYTQLSIP